jgi:hypothetical protein
MPVLIHFGGAADGSDEEPVGRNDSKRPAWSYCSDQVNEKDAFAETKLCRAPDEVLVAGATASVSGESWVFLS